MKHFSIFKRIGLTILVCLFQLNVWAQVKQISGTVSDEKGEPLIGVLVSKVELMGLLRIWKVNFH